MEKLKEKYEEILRLEDKLDEIEIKDLAFGEFVDKFNANYEFTEMGFEFANSDSEDMMWLINDFIKSGSKTWEEFNYYIYNQLIQIYSKYLDIVSTFQESESYTKNVMYNYVLEKLQAYYEDDEEVTDEMIDDICYKILEESSFEYDFTNLIMKLANEKHSELTDGI